MNREFDDYEKNMEAILIRLTEKMCALLVKIAVDLKKAAKGNRAAAQRVRVDTIELEKMAKAYRKESISAEKKQRRKTSAPEKKTAAKKATAKLPKKSHRGESC
jgi:hypothetical protein